MKENTLDRETASTEDVPHLALRRKPARVPADERARLKALRALNLLDSDPVESYDRITRFAARALDVPIVLLSLVDEHRQWFKSRVGLDIAETPRELSFCAHVVLDRLPLIVPDATLDERFADNPYVIDKPHVRAYVGVPIVTGDGYVIGSLCAIDNRGPRNFDAQDLEQLTELGKILEDFIHAQGLAQSTQDVLQFATQQVELFQDTFNQAAVGITHVAPSGRLLRVNQCLCEMLGYSEAELHDISFAEITHADDLEHSLEAFRRMRAGDLGSDRVEKRFRCKNGCYLWTEVSFALKRGSAVVPDYVIVVVVDISKRKLVQAELMAARDSLSSQVRQQTAQLVANNQDLTVQIQHALESERVAREAVTELKHFHYALDQRASVAVTDIDGTITYANKMFCETSGYSQSELVGQTHRIVKSGIHPPAIFEELWRTVLAGSVWNGELCNRKKTGELYWVDASIVPYKDETGRITRFVRMSTEITSRKRSEQLLAAEELKSRRINARLRQIADSVPAMISYWDQDRICQFANQVHFKRFGLTAQQIVGMSFENLVGSSFGERQRYVEGVMRGERQLFEHTMPMADGSSAHCRTEYVPHWEDERVIGFYTLSVDITEQRRVETELAQAQKLESIGQLAAGIAHEINTPAQFIGNNLGFLKDSVADVFKLIDRIGEIYNANREDMPDSVSSAIEAADLGYLTIEIPNAIDQSLDGINRIQTIVGAMKEFSHPATEKLPIDLNRAITTTITIASNEWKYVADVETHFDLELPHIAVMPGSFNQVILNIIVNAAHAVSAAEEMKTLQDRCKGKITVSTRRIDDWAEVRIQDTGCGIPGKIRDRIFDPFFTTKPVGKGTGQGLAIAHDVIVKKHGGAIAVESEEGAGSTFIIRLPILEEADLATAAG